MCTCDNQDLCCYFKETEKSTLSDYVLSCASGNENEEEQSSKEKFTSSLVAVTPSSLTFPYNNPKSHTQRLTLWNRTINALKIRIKSPDPEVFTILLDGKGKKANPRFISQIMLYGLAARTISIKCTPGRYKIARAPLQLFVFTSRDDCECLEVPLEIYPSTAWFNLPTTIVIPEVVVGKKAHALIILPQPRVSERFFVTFDPTYTQNAITIFPMHGTIGGDDGIRQLRVTYAPTEYTTVACIISVNFPGLSTETAHEIKILARCRPGNEADTIRKEIAEIESFRPKAVRRKSKYPMLLFKKRHSQIIRKGQEKPDVQLQPKRPLLSLFTLGGVMRFLLSKGDMDSHYAKDEHVDDLKRKTAVEILTLQVELQHEEKLKIYNSIKQRLGLEDFDKDQPGYLRPVVRMKKRRDWEEFQNAVGMALMGKVEELPPPPPEEQNMYVDIPRLSRFVRRESVMSGSTRLGGSTKHSQKKATMRKASIKKLVKKSVSEDEKKMYTSIMADVQLDLTPKQKFVQLVLTIITRRRAARRLSKIKVLIEDLKKATRKRSSKASTKTSNANKAKPTESSSTKRKSGQSQRTHDTGKYGSNVSSHPTILEQKKSGHNQKDGRRKSSDVQKPA